MATNVNIKKLSVMILLVLVLSCAVVDSYVIFNRFGRFGGGFGRGRFNRFNNGFTNRFFGFNRFNRFNRFGGPFYG